MSRWTLGLNELVQIATLLAVIVGAGAVIWELQQTRELVRLQMVSEGVLANRTAELTFAGEDPSAVLAKACDHPEQLTTYDYMVLTRTYYELVNHFIRLRLLEAGGLYEEGVWQQRTLRRFRDIFSTAPGRVWWERQPGFEPHVQEVLQELVDSTSPLDCRETFRAWKTRTMEIHTEYQQTQ